MSAAEPDGVGGDGDGDHTATQGECLASIAFDNGFLPATLWDHPGNSALKARRPDMHQLLPGDKVYIPKKRQREAACATDRLHRFVRKEVPEVLRIVLLDSAGQPRAAVAYTLEIAGAVKGTAKSDANGAIEVPIVPNAGDGCLVIANDSFEERYDLQLGAIDPPGSLTGVQARLNHLGFSCGEVDGEAGPRTAGAIGRFQQSRSLPVTGKLDDATRGQLVAAHGF